MNIDNRLNDPIFTPASIAGSQTRQDNEQRERIAPAEQADAFAGQDERRERGNDEVALYDARGQKTGAEASVAANNAEGEESEEVDTEQSTAEARPTKPSGEPMSEEEVLELQDLKERDREVRVHEQQHAAVGGQHAGSPGYEYETGPDGKQYAVEGEVQVDMSPVPNDPQATIEKMQQIKAAALAPAEPSQADKSAAARADQLIAEAQSELREQPQGNSNLQDKPSSANEAGQDTPSRSTTPAAEPDPAAPAPHNRTQLQQRNDVIAGVYGHSAEHQARALIGLA